MPPPRNAGKRETEGINCWARLIHLFLGTGSDRRWWSGLCEVLSTGVPSGF